MIMSQWVLKAQQNDPLIDAARFLLPHFGRLSWPAGRSLYVVFPINELFYMDLYH